MSDAPTLEPHDHAPADAGAIELVLEGRASAVGTLTVARLLPSVRRRTVGPFVFLDHLRPVTVPPGIGFAVLGLLHDGWN